MIPRVLEPEVMDTAQEAKDYDAMDHREVNTRFCDDLLAFVGRAPPPSDPGTVAAHERQRGLFEASLHAGLTVDEMRALARAAGIPPESVTMTSDRHWTLAARR